MSLRVVTWNLFHGRALPPRDEDLLPAFAASLAAWEWDVALLQEVPPWWPDALTAACGAQQRHALTSRNALLPLRRAIARRWPEAIKSNGGGCNAILVRELGITAHARRRVCLLPERRMVHAVRDREGRWFANLHASAWAAPAAHRDVARAYEAALRWSAGAPLVFGGDLNVRSQELPGMRHVAGARIDHVYTRGLRRNGPVELLDGGELSDHAPLRVTLAA